MKNILFLFLILLSLNSISQTVPEAKPILEKASTINNGYKTISSDFSFIATDLQSVAETTESGKILMKGEKYRLKLDKSDIIFDGKSIYHYMLESNEVNITNPEPAKTEKGDFFISNPRDAFSFYTKNFKSKWVKVIVIKGKTYNEIDLYPIDLKTKYTRITMHIEKATYHILDIKLAF